MYGVPEARDEYDSYVGQVGHLLREGANQDDLVAYFAGLMPHIGSPVNPTRDRVAAEKVLEWFEESMRRLSLITTTVITPGEDTGP